ncbi:hypothetical protein [Rhodococcus ruber]|uniref:hypothetical protein n=1 Tax=Rhodococcus ruber TaxID=1830 RepID=UPI001F1BE002|nr:hypothetical protein [Rhodococcus ruber]
MISPSGSLQSLRERAQWPEGAVGVDGEVFHQDAFCVADDVPGGHGGAELLFALRGDHRYSGMGGHGAPTLMLVSSNAFGRELCGFSAEGVIGDEEPERRHRPGAQRGGLRRERRPALLLVMSSTRMVVCSRTECVHGPSCTRCCSSSMCFGNFEVAARDSTRARQAARVMPACSTPGIRSTAAWVITSRVRSRPACSSRISRSVCSSASRGRRSNESTSGSPLPVLLCSPASTP